MVGNIAPGSPSASVGNISIYDGSGQLHTLTATLTDNSAVTPNSYTVSVKDETGAVVGTGTIGFGTDGTPLTGANKINLSLTYLGVTQTTVLNFGTPGAFDGARHLAGIATNLGAQVVDGHPLLGISNLSFDDKGVLQLVYSSTEKRTGPQIALASFPNESSLELVGGRLISGSSVQNREIGRPGEGVFGHIAGGSLELANVDLTQEFADMIIIQRGYQASSRVKSSTTAREAADDCSATALARAGATSARAGGAAAPPRRLAPGLERRWRLARSGGRRCERAARRRARMAARAGPRRQRLVGPVRADAGACG
jgi:flagellar hook protein FlgE